MNQTFTMACYNRKPVTRNRVASQKVLSLFNVTGTIRHKPICNCQSANWIQLIYKSWNVILGSKRKVTLFEIKDLWHLVLEHASLSQHDCLPVSPCLCLLESDPLNWWLSKIEVWHVLDLACHVNITIQVLKLLPANVVSANLDSILPSNDQHISISTICFWIHVFFSTNILSSLCWYTPKVSHGSPENLCFPSSIFLLFE